VFGPSSGGIGRRVTALLRLVHRECSPCFRSAGFAAPLPTPLNPSSDHQGCRPVSNDFRAAVEGRPHQPAAARQALFSDHGWPTIVTRTNTKVN